MLSQPASQTFGERIYVVTAPGLEGLAKDELRGLGLYPGDAPQDAGPRSAERARPAEHGIPGEDGGGGVAFRGSLEDIYRANLHLRTASRVLVRLGDFYAAGFPELRKKASRLGWERFLSPGRPVDLHVTCHKSRLYHSGAVAERVLAAIGDRLGIPSPSIKATAVGHSGRQAPQPEESRSAGEEDAGVPETAQMVVVRLVHDHCTISIDSSGELLHRRGYRLATAKAPLRETLAAAMLLAAGWDASASSGAGGQPALRARLAMPAAPLLDPFCGSGTIAIEAAMLARGIPPGHNRRFAFMNWPGFDPEEWQALLEASLPHQAVSKDGMPHPPRSPEACPTIQASDRDAGAIQLAQENAARAGIAECIDFSCRAVSAIQPPMERSSAVPGWVVTNPPYGLRVSANKDLRNLYAQLGNVLRAHCPGWHVAILCNDITLLGQTGLRLDTSFSTVNGGVSVRLGRGRV